MRAELRVKLRVAEVRVKVRVAVSKAVGMKDGTRVSMKPRSSSDHLRKVAHVWATTQLKRRRNVDPNE